METIPSSRVRAGALGALLVTSTVFLSGCQQAGEVIGTVSIDGSSTLNPMAQTAVAAFKRTHKQADVQLAAGGTTVGIQRLCERQVDVALASRPMFATEEEQCGANQVEVSEFLVANDAITVFVHPSNPMECISLERLAQVWRDPSMNDWAMVDPSLAKHPMVFFGADELSGTYAIFTQRVGGKLGAIRSDVDKNIDMAVAVRNVAQDPNAFGFSTSAVVDKTVKALSLSVDGTTCVAPTLANIRSGDYPLSRELYAYARKGKLNNPAILAFLNDYLGSLDSLATKSNLVPLTTSQKSLAVEQLTSLKHTAN
jgi:phosphate transport system substrate-binding protein